MNTLRKLTQYKRWADAVFFQTLSELTDAQLHAPQTIYFGSALRTLHHSYAMDVVWQSHLLGVPHGYTSRNPDQCPDFETLHWQQLALDQWYVDYAAGLSDSQASELIDFSFISGGQGTMSREDMIVHAVNHTTYHRGHVAAMLYAFGKTPPTTDYPVFVRQLPQAKTSH